MVAIKQLMTTWRPSERMRRSLTPLKLARIKKHSSCNSRCIKLKQQALEGVMGTTIQLMTVTVRTTEAWMGVLGKTKCTATRTSSWSWCLSYKGAWYRGIPGWITMQEPTLWINTVVWWNPRIIGIVGLYSEMAMVSLWNLLVATYGSTRNQSMAAYSSINMRGTSF